MNERQARCVATLEAYGFHASARVAQEEFDRMQAELDEAVAAKERLLGVVLDPRLPFRAVIGKVAADLAEWYKQATA